MNTRVNRELALFSRGPDGTHLGARMHRPEMTAGNSLIARRNGLANAALRTAHHTSVPFRTVSLQFKSSDFLEESPDPLALVRDKS
jgi:hypothetical protein